MQLIEKEALKNNIPIIRKDALLYLETIIKKHQVKTILEIGSAIGYSAIQMALIDEKIKITTIEKDEARYKSAFDNIKRLNLEKRIKAICGDAKAIIIKQKFDMIFIDASKSNNLFFFEKYKNNLNEEGIIITDNINFLLAQNNKSKRIMKLAEKIADYRLFLINNKDFTTEFINVGDGLSISYKRSKNV